MQFIWLVAFGCLAAASAFKINQNHSHSDSVNSRYLSFVNGSLEWLDSDKTVELPEDLSILNKVKVKYLLYTKSNPDKEQQITNNLESIRNSNFDPTLPTVFFIHGWQQDSTTSMSTDMRHAYFQNNSVNFIFVDWSYYARLGYGYAVSKVPEVGENLANMYDWLVFVIGVNKSDIIIVGHSLGAHVAGKCGKAVKRGPVQIMFALDPAGPLYKFLPAEKRFNGTDAKLTVQITTNAHQLGYVQNIGLVTIYVNDGQHQPGCDDNIINNVIGLCSHRSSVNDYIKNINSPQLTLTICESYEQALDNECLNGAIIQVTNYNQLKSGVYNLKSNYKSPYLLETV